MLGFPDGASATRAGGCSLAGHLTVCCGAQGLRVFFFFFFLFSVPVLRFLMLQVKAPRGLQGLEL